MLLESRKFQYSVYWHIVGWSYLALIVYLSLTPDPPSISDWPNIDKLEHFTAYGLLMGWFGQIYTGIRQQWTWVVLLSLLGVALEFAQGWGGYRFFDVFDMLANALGVLLGWWLSRRWLAGTLLRIDEALSRLLG